MSAHPAHILPHKRAVVDAAAAACCHQEEEKNYCKRGPAG